MAFEYLRDPHTRLEKEVQEFRVYRKQIVWLLISTAVLFISMGVMRFYGEKYGGWGLLGLFISALAVLGISVAIKNQILLLRQVRKVRQILAKGGPYNPKEVNVIFPGSCLACGSSKITRSSVIGYEYREYVYSQGGQDCLDHSWIAYDIVVVRCARCEMDLKAEGMGIKNPVFPKGFEARLKFFNKGIRYPSYDPDSERKIGSEQQLPSPFLTEDERLLVPDPSAAM